MLLCLEVLETKGKVPEILANVCRNLEIICLAPSFAVQVVKQVCGRPVLTGKLESLSAQMLLPYRPAVSNIPDYSERERTVLIWGRHLKCL